MRFLIISHAVHTKENNTLLSYAPYVREMNLWLKYVDEVEIIAPLSPLKPTKIDLAYKHNAIQLTKIPVIAFNSIKNISKSLFVLPLILFKMIMACRKADHIHLRCPGNVGLFGVCVQILFPSKVKTAKYAGNWDPNAKQPKSYKLQKRLLSNTFLSRNMNVLVYGNWKNQTKNIKSFFTATYTNKERLEVPKKNYNHQLNFIFVGSLVTGKRPLFAIKLVEQLQKQGVNCKLHIFGEGILRAKLEDYVSSQTLNGIVFHGNETKQVVKDHLLKSHFTILASKSEGWPKALAEAMFYGVIPIATKISCVPYMLGYGERGILIEPDLKQASQTVLNEIKMTNVLEQKAALALQWSQQYTLGAFEAEIKTLLV